jgi:hypothetical protein
MAKRKPKSGKKLTAQQREMRAVAGICRKRFKKEGGKHDFKDWQGCMAEVREERKR